MIMNHNIAFFGTGECDPNKSMKQFFIYAGIVAAWIVLIILLKKILHSRMHKAPKYILFFMLLLLGIIATMSAIAISWLAFACAR